MPSSRTIVWLGAVLISSATVTHAADINGVWASDTAVCNKVFTKKGGRVSFAKDADIHGSGFILDAGSVRGKLANCKIKARKQALQSAGAGTAPSAGVMPNSGK